MSGKRGSAVIAFSVVASVTAVTAAPSALAVTPKAGNYLQLKNGRELMVIVVSKGHVTNAIHGDSCATVPIWATALGPYIKITNGKFSWTGKATDVANRAWKIHVDGTFVTPTKAKGHWAATRLTGGSCTSKFAYVVTRNAGS